MSEKGRVVFLLKLKPGASEQFLEAYEGVRHEVAEGVKGHIVDQVCQSREDEDSWLITSEWESIDDFLAWEATEEPDLKNGAPKKTEATEKTVMVG